jgi:hypothetical protein
MKLDAQLWNALEKHGVTEAHLTMLLRLLELQRNGSWSWHYVNGQLSQCDARLTFPSRGYEVSRVCDTLLGGESILR